MNKQKFEAKCQELYAYEDELLKKMSEYVKPYNEEMNKYGYKVVARLLWYYPNMQDIEKSKLLKKREPISYKKAYLCNINVVICPTEIDLDDEANVELNEEKGISLNDLATSYSLSIWRGWSFRRGDGSYIYKNLCGDCDDIKNFGMEYVKKKCGL